MRPCGPKSHAVKRNDFAAGVHNHRIQFEQAYLLTGHQRVQTPELLEKAQQALTAGERLCLAAFRPNSFDADAAPVGETSFETREVAPAPNRVWVADITYCRTRPLR